jgi:hypothetical protein
VNIIKTYKNKDALLNILKFVYKRSADFIKFFCKGKAGPLQAWSDPDGSRKLRFTDFMTTAQDGGKVVSLYPQEVYLVLISVRG